MKLKVLLTATSAFFLLVSVVPGVRAAIIGSYSFEEGSGTIVNDASGHNNNGALVNLRSDSWTAGHSGGGLYFPGVTGASSTYVDLGNPIDFQLSNAFTFTAWVFNDAPDTDAPILAKEGSGGGLSYWFGAYYNHFGVLADHNGSYAWDLNRRGVSVSNWDQWNHLASTWDGATLRQYLNGNLVDTAVFSNELFNSSEPLTIGVNSGFNFTAFTGKLDEIHIYNNALSAAQIADDMHSVPVPSSIILLGCGIVGLACSRFRSMRV